MRKFQSLDRQARINSDYELDTKHQNTLTCLRIHTEVNDSVTKFSSSGLDGKIILWELNVSTTKFIFIFVLKKFYFFLNLEFIQINCKININK